MKSHNKEAQMRYIVTLLVIASALPVLSQTAEIDTLKANVLSAERSLNVATSKHAASTANLDSTLEAMGFAVEVDTLYAQNEGNYLQVTFPDSVKREALLAIRMHPTSYQQVSDVRIRMGKGRDFQRVMQALKQEFNIK